MITTGEYYCGPELEGSSIHKLLSATMKAAIAARGDWKEGASPGVNVVFYVPGSLGFEGPSKIEPARFSRKQRLLLVAVPVPRDVAESGGSVKFVISALHQANTIAAEVFANKGLQFDLSKAEAIVEKVREALVAQEF